MINNIETKEDYALLKIHSEKLGEFEFIIDIDQIDKVEKYRWNVSRYREKPPHEWKYYANTDTGKILLHRYLTDCPKGMVVDHKNRNTFDNQLQNLKIVTKQENRLNGFKSKANKSGYTGILWYHYRNVNKWMAHISVNGKRITIGYFNDINDAIEAREKAVEKYFGSIYNIDR